MSRVQKILRHFDVRDMADRESIRVGLNFLGVPIVLSSPEKGTAERVQDYFREYICDSARENPTVEIDMETLNVPSLWEDSDYEFRRDGRLVVQRDFAAREESVDTGGRHVSALISPIWHDAVLNLLRWVMPGELLRRDCLLLHGAGIVFNSDAGDRGYVFFGPSGSGKSTICRIIQQVEPRATILGDDVVILQQGSGDREPILHTAPLGSGYTVLPPPKREAILKGLFTLEKATENKRVPLHPSAMTAHLLGSTMLPEANEGHRERMAVCERIAKTCVEAARLSFRPDAKFWTELRGIQQ